MATIRDLQVTLTVDTDVEKGLTKAQFAFKETVREAENAQNKLDRIGRSSRDTDNDVSHLSSTMLRFVGSMSGIGAQSAFAVGKLGILTGSVLALSGAAASAISPVISLVTSLAPLAGGLAAIPGAIATVAVAFGVLKLSIGNTGDLLQDIWTGNDKKFEKDATDSSFAVLALAQAFREVVPQLKGFRDSVQEAFLLGFDVELQNVIDHLMLLKQDTVFLAMSLQNVGSQFITAFEKRSVLNDLATIISNTAFLVQKLGKAVVPLVEGFADLAVVGNFALLQLSGSVTKVAIEFGKWMQKVSDNGQAFSWIMGAVDVLKQLGSIFGDVGGILKGVFDAMKAAGSSALGVLGTVLGMAADWVKSAEGQKTLVAVFKALAAIGATLTPVLEAIAMAVGDLAPTIADLAKMLGPVLHEIVTDLAGGLKNAAPGIQGFFKVFTEGVRAFAPILGNVGTTFGKLLTALAPLIPLLLDLATSVLLGLLDGLDSIMPAISLFVAALVQVGRTVGPSVYELVLLLVQGVGKLLTALSPVLPVLGQLITAFMNLAERVLIKLFTALEPVLPILSDAAVLVGKALLDAVVELTPMLEDLTGQWLALLPAIVPIIPQLVRVALELMPPLMNVVKAILPHMSELTKLFVDIVATIAPLLPQLMQLALLWVPIATKITEVALAISTKFLPAADHLVKTVEDIVKKVVGWFQWLFDILLGHSIIPDIVNGIKNWFGKLGGWISDAIEFIKDLPGKFGDWFGRAKDAAIAKTTDLINWMGSLPGKIFTALGDIGRTLYESGRSVLQGLIDGLWSKLQDVMNTVGDILARIRAAFPFSPAKWGPFSGHGYTTYSGAAMMKDFAKGIRSQSGIVDSALTDALSHEITPTLTPSLAYGLAPSTGIPAFAGAGGVAGMGSIVIQSLSLNFADDRDMYQKGQEFAAGLKEYKRLGGELPS